MEKGVSLNRDAAQYVTAFGAFSVGTVLAWWNLYHGEWRYLIDGASFLQICGYHVRMIPGQALDWLLRSAWCSLAIAWFPFVAVVMLRRMKVEKVGFAAAIVSVFVGYDGVVRLSPGA